MSNVRLTCEETPLAWPVSIDINDLTTCSTCGIVITSPQPGSLQILTRRQGSGVGDGVNIEESPTFGVDYRGQRYGLEECIFHSPGLHIFPGQKDVYPAEYHIHMRTFQEPRRGITIVLPVSHLEAGPGQEYFAATSAKPDPSFARPTAGILFTAGTSVLQYQGPDIRGRTRDQPTTDACSAPDERQFLMVLQVLNIRAMDLERIPREGSASSDPRDLPAPGVSKGQTIARDRLRRTVVLASPGILSTSHSTAVAAQLPTTKEELECKPLKVVDGKDVIDENGQTVELATLLGGGTASTLKEKQQLQPGAAAERVFNWLNQFIFAFFVLVGFLIVDYLVCSYVWPLFFESQSAAFVAGWPPKYWVFVLMSLSAAAVPLDTITN
jgi:hypothetical protein